MWTGPKVISRLISPESIDEIAEVLRRKPVIWDNLHANDYDQKRIFLGPYSGRPSALLTKLKGVLTNPNCEYGANFVAIHTVAQWSKCNVDTSLENQSNDAISAVSADIKLEQESRSGRSDDEDPSLPMHIYHPRLALKKSLQLWLPEFKRTKSMWGPISKPHVSSVPPVTFNSSGQSAIPCSSTSSLEEGGYTSPGSAPMPTAEHSSEVNWQLFLVNFFLFLPVLSLSLSLFTFRRPTNLLATPLWHHVLLMVRRALKVPVWSAWIGWLNALSPWRRWKVLRALHQSKRKIWTWKTSTMTTTKNRH